MDRDSERLPVMGRLKKTAGQYHERIPWIRKLPGPAIAIILLLIIVQIVVWIAVGVVLHYNPALISTATLSYTLGLRHALDADHISAIDLMTRRLVASGQRPVTVGTFFSLGHSTIVIITSIVVAASSAAIQDRFGAFSNVGGIIGSSVSASFLIILGAMNIWILHKLHRQLQTALSSPIGSETTLTFTFEGGGPMTRLLRRTFKLIDQPWKMYPLGVLFGLGFDTSSEVALLGISAIQAARGTSIWLILLFPVLFTAGMCLLDTLDGAAMMSLYTSARLAKDTLAVLYYQLVLTALTVAVALAIGALQLLTLAHSIRPSLSGPFWAGVDTAAAHYDVIGGGICGSFVVFGGLAVLLYGPWRRRVDRRREARALVADGEDCGSEELGAVKMMDAGRVGDVDAESQKGEGRKSAGKHADVKTTVRPAGESSRGL